MIEYGFQTTRDNAENKGMVTKLGRSLDGNGKRKVR
jgi:hypothetical protein